MSVGNIKPVCPVALIILDGFGHREQKKDNAIAHAYMPYFNDWWDKYPRALLNASGAAVGLPDGMIGNSEVGHLVLGAGRVVEQAMSVWLNALTDGSFLNNSPMNDAFGDLLHAGGALHIMGLLSDAGVHAHDQQIHAVIDAAVKAGIKKIVVHAFLDGRDVAPQSARFYLQRLYTDCIHHYHSGQVILGSIHGRFYAMDRDNNWDRIEKSYRVLTEKQEHGDISWEKVVEHNYAQGITDEFIMPVQLTAEGVVHNGDMIFFCNIRPDRARQLTACFLTPCFIPFILKPLNLTCFITPVAYADNLPSTVLFPRGSVCNTLKDVLAAHKKIIFTIAETEKYAHVTYFFRGENEEFVPTETRIMVPSVGAKHYKDYPEMSAALITESVIASLENDPADFYLINYANADMVGHSGDFDATVAAVEFLDIQLKRLYDVIAEKMGGTIYITADHGKAELMYDEAAHSPRTAHTSNPVPFLMLRKDKKGAPEILPLTELAHVAPFILKNMGLPVPDEMAG